MLKPAAPLVWLGLAMACGQDVVPTGSRTGAPAMAGSAGSAFSLGGASSAGIAGASMTLPSGGNAGSGGAATAQGGATGLAGVPGGGHGGALATCPKPGAAVCLDFENGDALSGFELNSDDISVAQPAHPHGGASLTFANLTPHKQATIETTELPGITDTLWGRFYLLMDAGAPDGHGALVAAFDQDGNWYELGFQFSAFHGNWHVPAGVPERWMNSDHLIPREWSCVEFLFDGAAAKETQIWSNGELVEYTQKAGSPDVEKVARFQRLALGFMAYHGTSLDEYEGDAEPSAHTLYIDDLLLGPARLGCD